jgi:hypothetical protein
MTDRSWPLTRAALPLAVVALQLVAGYLVLGVPNLGAAKDFLTTHLPTMPGSIAASQVLVWLLLLVACLASTVSAVGSAMVVVNRRRRARLWSAGVMGAGLLILAVGIGHHLSSNSVDISGGSVDEARAQLAR